MRRFWLTAGTWGFMTWCVYCAIGFPHSDPEWHVFLMLPLYCGLYVQETCRAWGIN